MTTDQIISAFGGRAEIAKITGAKANAVTQWLQAGVPSKFWHVLVINAQANGIEGITFDVLEATKRRGATMACAQVSARMSAV